MKDLEKKWKTYKFGNLPYRVSNYGEIIGEKRGRAIKQRINQDGYLVVTVGDVKHRRVRFVHRIVAELFVPNNDPLNKKEVNHLDACRTNPRADNLEWTTHTDNVTYSVALGHYDGEKFRGEKNPNYGNDTLKKKYAKNPELAKKNNSRPKDMNGRAVKIELLDINKNIVETFSYIGECCEWLINNGFTRTKSVDQVRVRIWRHAKDGTLYMHKFYFNKLDK